MSQAAAAARATEIRARLESLAGHLEEIPALVREAWTAGDWETLGYGTWKAYVTGEFGTELLRLDRSVRKEWVRQLTGAGMSTREIAPVVNASDTTVMRDQGWAPPASNEAGRSASEPAPAAASDVVSPDCGLAGAACARCAELEVECVRLSERGAEQYNELERIHDSYKFAFEKAQADRATALARVRRLEADLAGARARISALEAEPRWRPPGADPIGGLFSFAFGGAIGGKGAVGPVYDDKTAKMLNLAIANDSEPEAVQAFMSARVTHRKANMEGRK